MGVMLRKAKQNGELLHCPKISLLAALIPLLTSSREISLLCFPKYLNISGRCVAFLWLHVELIKCLSFFLKTIKGEKGLS